MKVFKRLGQLWKGFKPQEAGVGKAGTRDKNSKGFGNSAYKLMMLADICEFKDKLYFTFIKSHFFGDGIHAPAFIKKCKYAFFINLVAI